MLFRSQFSKRNRAVDWQCEALLHHGPIWQRQPQDPVLRVSGAGGVVLPAVLPCLQDPVLRRPRKKDVTLLDMQTRDFTFVVHSSS